MADDNARNDGNGDPRRSLRYRLENLAARLGFGLFALLPLAAASALGGWLGRTVGPHLAVSRRARSNLERFMPELDQRQRRQAVRELWDNLGRVTAELPHLNDFHIAETAGAGSAAGAIELRGVEHVHAANQSGRAVMLIGAHMGNWEVQALANFLLGYETHVVYRAANNPLFDDLVRSFRKGLADAVVPKGAAGARRLMKLARGTVSIGMLVDQKMNDGIAVPFFGVPAMTAPAAAQLALRFKLPLIVARCERLEGSRFRLTILPPMALPDSGDRNADVLEVMTAINRTLEGWIRERPGQWLWVHRRWPD